MMPYTAIFFDFGTLYFGENDLLTLGTSGGKGVSMWLCW